MAKPRVFVSSTYYDLKYIRASLEFFVKSLGFDPILSEKGDIAYTPDGALDESCYREVENSDIFVLIIGGRYGSEASPGTQQPKTFWDHYDSITKKEYINASEHEIPIYVLIEKSVYAEYRTFLLNRESSDVKYAHVDSANVFFLIEYVLSQPRNNPVQPFEKFEDIEVWLREQWAGHYRELLKRQSQQEQLKGLSQQVIELKETNETLRKYLEAVMRNAGQEERRKLIEREEKRLSELRKLEELRNNRLVNWICRVMKLDDDTVAKIIRNSETFEDVASYLIAATHESDSAERLHRTLRASVEARHDLNAARKSLGLPNLKVPEDWTEDEAIRIAMTRDQQSKRTRISPEEAKRIRRLAREQVDDANESSTNT